MSRIHFTAGVITALAALSWARQALAVGADEWRLSVQGGAANVRADRRRVFGGLAGIELSLGLSDSWAARGSVGSSWHPVASDMGTPVRPEGVVRATTVGAGLVYSLDVLRIVPFADA